MANTDIDRINLEAAIMGDDWKEVLLRAKAQNFLDRGAFVGADTANQIPHRPPEHQAKRAVKQTILQPIEPGGPKLRTLGDCHIRILGCIDDLGQVSRLDL